MDHLCFVSCVSHALASANCCLVVTCWGRADLLTLVGEVYCIFVNFPFGILGQVWYSIVSFPNLCLLSYFVEPYFMICFLLPYLSSLSFLNKLC